MNSKKLEIITSKLLAQLPRAESIQIALGELNEFDETQIRQFWDELVANTPLEKKNLNIRIIEAKQQCMTCFLVYRPTQKETACPQCGSLGAKIISGEEFHLESI